MQKLSKLTFFFSLLFLTLPLVFTSFTMFPWLFGKTIFFQMGIEILALLGVVLLWKDKKFTVKKLNGLDWTVYAFLAALFLTALFGENFSQSFWPTQMRSLGVFTWLHFGLWYFFLTQLVDSTKKWLWLMSWSVGVGALVGLTGVFQSMLPATWRGDGGGARLSGILGNPAFFASYLIVNTGLAFFLFTQKKEKIRLLFLGLGIFLMVCIFLTGIRGAVLGLVCGIITFLLFWILQMVGEKSSRRKSIIIAGVLLLLLGAGIAWAFKNTDKLPVAVQRLTEISLSSDTGSTRLMAWKIAWDGFREQSLGGWGWGTFDIVFNRLYNPEFLRYGFQETQWDKPHNSVLEMLVAMGVFGVLYLAVFGISIFFCIVHRDKTYAEQTGAGLILAILVAYGVQVLLLFETTNVLLPLFLVLAFISFAYGRRNEEPSKKVGVPVLFLATGAVVLCLALWSQVTLLKTSSLLDQTLGADNGASFQTLAKQTLQRGGPLHSENAVLIAEHFTKLEKGEALTKENVSQWQESALLTAQTLEQKFFEKKNNPTLAVWSGQVYMILGQMSDEKYYVQANALLEAAHTLAPKKQEILFLQNRIALLQKDFARSFALSQQAVALEPSIGTSHWFLGLSHIAAGEAAVGLQAIETALAKGYSLKRLSERLYLIDIYAQEKQYDKVIFHYKLLRDGEKDNVNWYIKLASAYALAGDKKLALETVKEALNMYPPLKADAEAFIKQYNLE